MQRDSIVTTITRLIIGFGIFTFLCLIYWSSTIIEEELIEIRRDLREIQNSIFSLDQELEMIRSGRMSTYQPNAPSSQASNLLESDPFYEKTLPDLLGSAFEPHGILHGATVGKPAHLHPFSNWSQVSGWHDMCSVSIARQQFGKYETLAPYMATYIEEKKKRESPNIGSIFAMVSFGSH